MKTVFTDISTIAHLWANKTQSEAKNSGRNFYFESDTIYSYGRHFPIAKHIENNGINAVLFTERSYSNTTAKHIAVVRQSSRHLNIIDCLSPESSRNENFNYWQKCIESEAGKLLKAKKPEIYLSKIDSIKDKINRYVKYFDIEIPGLLSAAMQITDKTKYNDYAANKETILKEQKAKEQKELKKAHKIALDKWLKLETSRLYTHDGFDYLRVNDNRIETTQAVKIPLEVAKRLYSQIKDNTLQVGAKILDYSVQSIGKEIKIGCHNFKTSYLLSFGSKL